MTEHKDAGPEAARDPGYPYGTFDAAEWAAEFKRLFPDSDESLMLGWFANAIMTGYDKGSREAALAATQPAPSASDPVLEAQYQLIKQVAAPSASADAAWEALGDDIWSDFQKSDASGVLASPFTAIARHRPAIEAAIRAERGPALDVDRLSRAIARTPGLSMRLVGEPREWVEYAVADAIAAEYARLAAQPASEPPETGG